MLPWLCPCHGSIFCNSSVVVVLTRQPYHSSSFCGDPSFWTQGTTPPHNPPFIWLLFCHRRKSISSSKFPLLKHLERFLFFWLDPDGYMLESLHYFPNLSGNFCLRICPKPLKKNHSNHTQYPLSAIQGTEQSLGCVLSSIATLFARYK